MTNLVSQRPMMVFRSMLLYLFILLLFLLYIKLKKKEKRKKHHFFNLSEIFCLIYTVFYIHARESDLSETVLDLAVSRVILLVDCEKQTPSRCLTREGRGRHNSFRHLLTWAPYFTQSASRTALFLFWFNLYKLYAQNYFVIKSV